MSRLEIEAYQFGRIVVGGQPYTKDLSILVVCSRTNT